MGLANVFNSTVIRGFVDYKTSAAPAVSPAGQARVYFNGTQLQVSQNGGAYGNLVGGGGGGTLAATLALGNTTGSNHIIVSTGFDIIGAVELDLRTTGGGVTSGALVVATGNTINGLGGASGDVSITTGNATVGGDSVFSGSISLQTGTGEDTGQVAIATGNADQLTGSVLLSTGDSTNSGSGNIDISVGASGGTSACGSIYISTPGGYTAGSIDISAGGAGPGGGGGLLLSAVDDVSVTGGDLTITANGGADTNADILIQSVATTGSITLIRNPGTPTTTVIVDDTGLSVNGLYFTGSGLGDGTGSIDVDTQSGSMGGNGTSLYITPNLGIILEIGNTIKIDPDGTNNWIYGDDGAVATNPGEPLTLRGGHGNTTGAGAALRLRGGDGGNTTGNGGNVEIQPGATTGGTAGTACLGTATSQFLRFYGTTAGTAQQSITGSRSANAALADLLTKLATLGLIVDTTTA